MEEIQNMFYQKITTNQAVALHRILDNNKFIFWRNGFFKNRFQIWLIKSVFNFCKISVMVSDFMLSF